MARKIVFTSGKGGVGKTTVCANLGLALAAKSLRVVAVDLDMGLNNLDVALGLDNRVVFDLVDVLDNRCRVRQALIQSDEEQSLFVMPSCHQSVRLVTDENVKRLIDKLDADFDYVLIDCPAGMESGFRRAVFCADEAVVVVTPHISSVRDADKVTRYLAGQKLLAVNVVVNRVRGDLVAGGELLSPFEVFSLLGQKPLGIIPEDDKINCNFTAEGEHSLPYKILADNLHSGTEKMFDCVSRYKNFFARLFRGVK